MTAIEKSAHWRDRAKAAEVDLVIANSALDNLARKLTAAENERDALRAENEKMQMVVDASREKVKLWSHDEMMANGKCTCKLCVALRALDPGKEK